MTYDRDLISRCLGSLETQKLGWTRWFEANRINPNVVTYEKLAADTASVVSGIVKLLGVQDDEPHAIQVRTSAAAERRNEQRMGYSLQERDRARCRRTGPPLQRSAWQGARAAGPAIGLELEPALHFFDRYDRIKFTEAEDRQGGLGVFAKKRRRDRYEAMIGRNRELFQTAQVLDFQCGSGIWSLAALDAGAAHVVGVDSRKKPIDTASETLHQIRRRN